MTWGHMPGAGAQEAITGTTSYDVVAVLGAAPYRSASGRGCNGRAKVVVGRRTDGLVCVCVRMAGAMQHRTARAAGRVECVCECVCVCVEWRRRGAGWRKARCPRADVCAVVGRYPACHKRIKYGAGCTHLRLRRPEPGHNGKGASLYCEQHAELP